MHAHGITLILWCLMLIVQPWLIRTKRRPLHRTVGKISYLLLPLMIFTTLSLLHYRMPVSAGLKTMDYLFVALVVNGLIVFLVLYSLAMCIKAKPTGHARYML